MAAARSSPAFGRGQWLQSQWWHMFGDPQLDKLVDEALAGSPDIKVAEARARLAEQAAMAVHAGNLPQVSANGSISRERFSKNGMVPPPFAGGTENQGQLSLDATYDLDLWSRNRDTYRARLSEVQAAVADKTEVRLVIATAVASVYLELQGNLARLDVANEALRQRQELADLVKLRADKGLETLVAVKQAEADIAREEANVIVLERAVGANKRQLAALMGAGPDAAELIAVPVSHFARAFPLPEVVPMDLLSRRPDITAARWRVEAAARQVGAARAGFYPNVNIAASAGWESVGLKDLLKRDSVFALFGPAVHLPIFEGGRLRANLRASYAEYDIAVWQYHRGLVSAARDVADELAAVESVVDEQQKQAQALSASEEAYRIAVLRYKNGITDYLTVLQAQRDLLRQRDVNAQLAQARLRAIVGLIKALGGGYDAQGAVAAAVESGAGHVEPH